MRFCASMSSEMVLALSHTGASSPRRRDLCSNGNNTSHSRVQDDVAATLKEIRAMAGSSSGAITNSVVRSSMSTSSREADTAARNRESCKPYAYDSWRMRTHGEHRPLQALLSILGVCRLHRDRRLWAMQQHRQHMGVAAAAGRTTAGTRPDQTMSQAACRASSTDVRVSMLFGIRAGCSG